MGFLEVGYNRVCYSENYTKIICNSFDGNTNEIFESKSAVQFYFQSSKIYSKSIIKNDYLCTWNLLKFECFGSNKIVTSIPNEFKNIDYGIYDIIGSNDNICFIAKFTSIEYKIKCWGDPDTGINNVPNSFDIIESKELYNIKYSIGIGTICVIVNFQSSLSQCWGICEGNICDLPSYLLSDKVMMISVGQSHACIVNSNYIRNVYYNSMGSLLCWGSDEFGQTTIPDKFRNYITEVATSAYLTCALKYNGRMECWGVRKELFPNSAGYKLKEISTGGRHTCGTFRGYYSCWGSNEFGQLELGGHNQYEFIGTISAGWDFSCYYGSNDQVNCIGFNYYGQTDVPDGFNHKYGNKVLKVYSGLSHSCVIYNNELYRGRLWCYGGQNEHNELDTPKIEDIFDISHAALGDDFTCTVSALNFITLYFNCFGNNESGQSVEFEKDYVPYVEISAGGSHACILSGLYIGEWIHCWGSDSVGQASTPMYLSKTFSLALGETHSCVVEYWTADIVCWGSWKFRKADLNPQWLDTAFEYACVVSDYDEGVCWGDNDFGQCDVPVLDTVK